MTIYETLKATLAAIDLINDDEAKLDEHVTELLKCKLCFETSKESYDYWVSHLPRTN